MFSRLRKGLVYRDTSSDISEHDDDYESELWNYDGRDVYRGSFDPKFVTQNLHVYSLYDDNSKRVGIAEHEIDAPEVFTALWFYDTPFGTLFQNPEWKSKNETIWSRMSHEAYQDCIETDVREKALNSGVFLMMPEDCISLPQLYSCESCGKKSFVKFPCGKIVEFSLSQFRVLFMDENFILYETTSSSLPHDAFEAHPERSEGNPHSSPDE